MRKLVMLAAFVMLSAVMSRSAGAQMDTGGRIYLLQDGMRVGEVFVPVRATGAVSYEEHWVLYSKYKYPGPQELRGLVIKAEPSEVPYADTNDFFRRVPWSNKSRYIHITATESSVKAPIGR